MTRTSGADRTAPIPEISSIFKKLHNKKNKWYHTIWVDGGNKSLVNGTRFAVICVIQIVASSVESSRARERAELTTAHGCSFISLMRWMLWCHFIKTYVVSRHTKSESSCINKKTNRTCIKKEKKSCIVYLYSYFSLKRFLAINSTAAVFDWAMASGECGRYLE